MEVTNKVKPTTNTTTAPDATPAKTADTPAKKTKKGAEKVFDQAFANMPKTALAMDFATIRDVTNASAPEFTRREEQRRTEAVLDQMDAEIEAAVEAQREPAAQQAQALLRNAHVSSIAARSRVEAQKAADAGITPLASNVAPLASASVTVRATPASQRSARMGLDSKQFESRLAEKLNGALV